jgi:hypothetical protein
MTVETKKEVRIKYTEKEKYPSGGDIFSTRPDRSWGQPSHLYNRYRVSFSGVKRHGVALKTHPSSAEVKERVELYLYSPFWAFLACLKVNVFIVYR